MTMKPIILHWQLIDPETNKARWYSLATSKDLWGNTVLIKRWGRINRRGQEKLEWFNDAKSLRVAIQKTHKRRLNHQYQLIGSESHRID